MLDLNVDAAFSASSDDEAGGPCKTAATADSVTSTTTTSATNNAAAAAEGDCNSWSLPRSASTTLNFSILDKHVIEIEEDDAKSGVAAAASELQLFPVASSPAMVRAKYWLNLSVPEIPGGGAGEVELGIYKAQLPATNPAQPVQAKKSRRGPRSRSSQYRGVTFYRRTGRWESHIWYNTYRFLYLYLYLYIHILIACMPLFQ